MGWYDFKEFFRINRRERRGLFVLAGILAVYVFFLLLGDRFLTGGDNDLLAARLDSMAASLTANAGSTKAPAKPGKVKDSPELPRHSVNPNRATPTQWKALGLKQYQIHAIEKYRKAAGDFYNYSQFRKLRVLNDSAHKRIKPFLKFPARAQSAGDSFSPDQSWSKSSGTDSWKKWKPGTGDTLYGAKPASKYVRYYLPMDINRADTSELKNVWGIGSFFAGEMVKYRQKLGGYVSYMQLLELPLLTRGRLDTLVPRIELDPTQVHTISVNSATAELLASHPYISFSQANAIIAYRMKNGSYENLDELADFKLLPGKTLKKITPYLRLN